MMAIVNWLLDGMDRVERMERQLTQVDWLVTTVADLKYQVSCLQDRQNDRLKQSADETHIRVADVVDISGISVCKMCAYYLKPFNSYPCVECNVSTWTDETKKSTDVPSEFVLNEALK